MPKRTDENQSDIVKDLRKIGASVESLAPLGSGAPDLLVGFRGTNYAFEVKNPARPPSGRSLTPDETKWHNEWRGQVDVVESFDDVMRIVGREGERVNGWT